jgi:histidinol-phosphatase (PHP family)
MRLACARAVELGLPGLAFTEHVDFTDWILADGRRVAPLDVEGYLADVARCRDEFPELRILAGIEAGEPHLFPGDVGAVLSAGNFERVLGSLHGIDVDGTLSAIGHAQPDGVGVPAAVVVGRGRRCGVVRQRRARGFPGGRAVRRRG